MRLSEEEMAREVKRAKRFNTIAFIVVIVLTAAVIIGFRILDKKLPALIKAGSFYFAFK